MGSQIIWSSNLDTQGWQKLTKQQLPRFASLPFSQEEIDELELKASVMSRGSFETLV